MTCVAMILSDRRSRTTSTCLCQVGQNKGKTRLFIFYLTRGCVSFEICYILFRRSSESRNFFLRDLLLFSTDYLTALRAHLQHGNDLLGNRVKKYSVRVDRIRWDVKIASTVEKRKTQRQLVALIFDNLVNEKESHLFRDIAWALAHVRDRRTEDWQSGSRDLYG